MSFSPIQLYLPNSSLICSSCKSISLFLPAVPVSDVTITSDVPEAVEHNSTVVLTCKAKGSFLKFTWLKGTTPIVPDGKHFTEKSVSLHVFLNA